MTVVELVAFLFGLLYLIGISFSKRWGWLFGILNAALYIYLCIDSQLYIQANLQGIYVLFGVYGYIAWGQEAFAKVNSWALGRHIVFIAAAICLGLVFGFVLWEYSPQKMPFMDAFIAVFAILATYLTAHHIIENWYYWIFINIASILLFLSQDLFITAGMYLVNLGMSFWGLYKWKTQKQATA